jgi:hypothetical protein
MSSTSTRRLALRGALALSLAGGSAAYWLLRTPGVSEPEPAPRAEAPDVSERRRAEPPPARRAAHAAFVPSDAPSASYAAALTMYREYSKFPPNSRPVDESYSDIAQPALVASAPQPLLATDAAGHKLASGVYCTLQPEEHNVSAGQQQRITLTCQRGPQGAPNAPPLAVLVEGMSAEVVAEDGKVSALPLNAVAFGDDGSRGDEVARDGVYTASLATSEQAAPGQVTFVAQVRVADREASDPATAQPLQAGFAIAPPAPARFTGKATDALEQGSLVVTVELEVERAGRYRVFANLEHSGELMAYAKEDLQLDVGIQQVPLLFFGKILRDAGLNGPFQVTQLRGQRFNLEPGSQGPLNEPLRILAQAHETSSYRASEFSSKEWTSPYKDERIAELTELAATESN